VRQRCSECKHVLIVECKHDLTGDMVVCKTNIRAELIDPDTGEIHRTMYEPCRCERTMGGDCPWYEKKEKEARP
jgi:hypothetical protein